MISGFCVAEEPKWTTQFALLTSASGELRRLSRERNQAQTKSVELERSMTTTTKSRAKLEKRVTTLTAENESLHRALVERQEVVPIAKVNL